jgi:hypothetical protein
MKPARRLSLSLLAGLLGGILNLAAQAELPVTVEKPAGDVHESRGAFTGSGVPSLAPLLGDFVNEGVRTPENRTDIPRLLTELKKMGAQDYLHMVWNAKRGYPSAWQDFLIMAPEFQKAHIGLWLYLTPPARKDVPDPFGADYVRWAVECAKVAAQYPMVKGICIDDFNGAVKKFTPAYCRQMMTAAHKIAPQLAFMVVCYFGYEQAIAGMWRQARLTA